MAFSAREADIGCIPDDGREVCVAGSMERPACGVRKDSNADAGKAVKGAGPTFLCATPATFAGIAQGPVRERCGLLAIPWTDRDS